jgi:hypothetical protein
VSLKSIQIQIIGAKLARLQKNRGLQKLPD